jgi:hypothetical protein
MSVRRHSSLRVLSWIVGLSAVVMSSSCAGAPEVTGPSESVAAEPTVAPVVGGQTSNACDWPSTVGVNGFASCTGTLIHPRIVTTAAHCLMGDTANIYFGTGKDQPGSFSLSARCVAGAQGTSGADTNKDWGYCVLPEDDRVKQIPITPPLVGCEADRFLKAGVSAWVVGFGTTSSAGLGAGVKRAVEVKVNAIDQPIGTINVGDATVGACHGDSGGPIYIHLADSTHDWGYRVFGSTSGAGDNNCDCTCSTVYINIANHVAAIEKNENIDVTPCTDSAGNWAPSADCKAFELKPDEGTGTFPACNVGVTTDPIATCDTAGLPAAGSGGASDALAGAGGHAGAAGAAGATAGSGGRSGAGAVNAGVGGMSAAGAGGAGAAGHGIAGISGFAGYSGVLVGAAGGGIARPGAGLAGVGAIGTLSNAQTGIAGAGAVGLGIVAAQAGAMSFQPAPAPLTKAGCQIVRAGGAALPDGLGAIGLAFVFGWRLRRRQRHAVG